MTTYLRQHGLMSFISLNMHASDSVYKDVHVVRNTLCGLLTSKINVFKGTNCHEWKPTGDLLACCKSATYQALTM